ncbi:SCO family protein [Marinobacter sp. VGCF2001]|uniref:SCO family protein n=1 Tax=Marinobacter sp. VGCF2001 TaxID=3417189 RepID=UPI003CED106B
MQKVPAIALVCVLISGLLVAFPVVGYLTRDNNYYGFKTNLEVPPLPGYRPGNEQVRLVFFGYQHCGTVCPLQLVNLKKLQRRLTNEPVRFVFVTLDPERDSQQELDRIMAGMGDGFYAVRPASQAAAQNLAMGFAEYAGKTGSGDHYDFDHSARIYAVTADNRRQLLYASPDLDLARVEDDIQRLLSRH